MEQLLSRRPCFFGCRGKQNIISLRLAARERTENGGGGRRETGGHIQTGIETKVQEESVCVCVCGRTQPDTEHADTERGGAIRAPTMQKPSN